MTVYLERLFRYLQTMVYLGLNQQLADATFLSVNTVKTHLKSVYRKLLVKTRSEAVAKAKDLHLLEL